MKIAITGLSNSGKTTVFNALTGQGVETTVYATTSGDPQMGMVKVPDARVTELSAIFKPKKTSPSTVHYVDHLGLTKGDLKQNRQVFELVKDSDALVHVVRAFKDEAVAHPHDKIDPLSDIATVEIELVFGDLELVERRIKAIEVNKKKGNKPANPEEEKVLIRCKDILESEKPLRDMEFAPEEERAIRHLQFMSVKPMIVVLNISEDALGTDETATLVKNADGTDSPATVRAAMQRLWAEWLAEAGHDIRDERGEPDRPIEISPLFALSADELRDKLPPDWQPPEQILLGP